MEGLEVLAGNGAVPVVALGEDTSFPSAGAEAAASTAAAAEPEQQGQQPVPSGSGQAAFDGMDIDVERMQGAGAAGSSELPGTSDFQAPAVKVLSHCALRIVLRFAMRFRLAPSPANSCTS